METGINSKDAILLLKKYNKEDFHLLHALTVSKVMSYFAKELGYEDDIEFWETVGLLHDIDFENYPQAHCVKAEEILKENNAGDDLIHAVTSHGYGICSDVKPEHIMEKVLFATDELTGLIGASVKMRPSKSVKDFELSSLKKKFKDKKFAAGCSRDVIKEGASMLGWDLDKLFEETIKAMKSCEDEINETLNKGSL